MSSESYVNEMFDGKSIFITGASGFLGRVLVEKLLRSYPGIKNMYLLFRSKKGTSPIERLEKDLLSLPIFDLIKSQSNGKEVLGKIIIVPGDIQQPQLGISDKDLDTMCQDKSLSVVFHVAATIKFDEPLQVSVAINLIATESVLTICRKLQNLTCICHCSTAYVNSDRKDNQDIDEKLYPINYHPRQIIELVKILDPKTLQVLKSHLIDQRPNSYTYTKALAEHLVSDESYNDLPICIVRPSIVTAAWKEPIKGWVDNINGPTGLLLAIGKGFLRTMHVKRDVVADMIPVDIVVNVMIATAFYTAKKFNKLDVDTTNDLMKNESPAKTMTIAANNQKPEKECPVIDRPLIVHCTSGDVNPLTWGDAEDSFLTTLRRYPSGSLFRYPFGTFKRYKYHDMITRFFVHLLPAIIIDILTVVIGKKGQVLHIYKRIHCALTALSHFCTQNYKFKSRNIKLVEAELSDFDKEQLTTTIKDMSWNLYWNYYVLGTRKFVLKEPNDTLPAARETLQRIYYVEIAYRAMLAAAALVLGWAAGHWLS